MVTTDPMVSFKNINGDFNFSFSEIIERDAIFDKSFFLLNENIFLFKTIDWIWLIEILRTYRHFFETQKKW